MSEVRRTAFNLFTVPRNCCLHTANSTTKKTCYKIITSTKELIIMKSNTPDMLVINCCLICRLYMNSFLYFNSAFLSTVFLCSLSQVHLILGNSRILKLQTFYLYGTRTCKCRNCDEKHT